MLGYISWKIKLLKTLSKRIVSRTIKISILKKLIRIKQRLTLKGYE